jgi:DNA modification methylase
VDGGTLFLYKLSREDDTVGNQTCTSLDRRERLNALCPYFTMFPLSVPARQLKGLAPDQWVLDPFCGRGTTNFAARLLGLPSVGIDSNPVAAAITEGKMVPTTAESVGEACVEILSTATDVDVPSGDFWRLCFHSQTLSDLCRLRADLLRDCRSAERKALRALVLGLLHGPRTKGVPSYLSNQMPRTYAAKPEYAVRFWTKRGLEPGYVDLAELVKRKAHHYFTPAPESVPFRVICGDSRAVHLADSGLKFSRVVTSPPYLGMRTYVPDQWLRYWFVGGPAAVTYRHADQFTHASAADFARQLGSVWANVARACLPGARMVIRFGGIHDRKANPKEVMLAALREAQCGLRLLTIRSAGLSSRGKRQAGQFKRALRNPIEELDFYVQVEGA